MTSRKRLIFSYCCLALLLAVLFAVSLFWGSVALTPQAVLAALTGRGQDALSVGIITQLRLPRAVMAALLGAALWRYGGYGLCAGCCPPGAAHEHPCNMRRNDRLHLLCHHRVCGGLCTGQQHR